MQENASLSTASNQFIQLPDESLLLQRFQYRRPMLFPDHVHNEYSLVVCLRGSIIARQRGFQETLHPGEVVITSPGVFHASNYAQDGVPSDGLSITLSWRALVQFAQQLRLPLVHATRIPVFLGKQTSEDLRVRAEAIAKEIEMQEPGYRFVAEGLAQRLLADVLRRWPPELVSQQDPREVQPLERWQFVVAVEHLGLDPDWERSLAAIAERLGCSTADFQARFQASTALTLDDCNLSILLHRAQQELLHGDASVANVAARLGFRSANHLTGALRSTANVCPGALRKGLLAKRMDAIPARTKLFSGRG
ncbi:MAG: helix-turn-helix domain-containing protein [Bryobacterales bacterium]|nr:helix-turn-helix domain-containing protein [Bryobacterales bacterium]